MSSDTREKMLDTLPEFALPHTAGLTPNIILMESESMLHGDLNWLSNMDLYQDEAGQDRVFTDLDTFNQTTDHDSSNVCGNEFSYLQHSSPEHAQVFDQVSEYTNKTVSSATEQNDIYSTQHNDIVNIHDLTQFNNFTSLCDTLIHNNTIPGVSDTLGHFDQALTLHSPVDQASDLQSSDWARTLQRSPYSGCSQSPDTDSPHFNFLPPSPDESSPSLSDNLPPIENFSSLADNIQLPDSSTDTHLSVRQASSRSESVSSDERSVGPSPPCSPGGTKRPHILPPCRVCEAPASGYHYGANTCEACKGFFRRSMVRKQQYVCSRNQRCLIGNSRRKICAYCRYQRCLEAGMSRDGIKTGRYTYEKRTRDILEIQQKKMEEVKVKNETAMKDRMSRAKETMGHINSLLDKHSHLLDHTVQRNDLMSYLEARQLLEETFGSIKLVDMQEFLTTYSQTGIELDNRRDITDCLLQGFEQTLFPALLAFTRDIPGFGPLKFQHVLSLLKDHFFELWLVQNTECVSQQGYMISQFNTSFEMSQLVGSEGQHSIMSLFRRLRALNLSLHENIMLQAVVILIYDQCDLENPESIESLLTSYLECFECVLTSQHPEEPRIFAKVMQVIVDLRSASCVLRQGLAAILKTMNQTRYPLLTEIIEASS